MLKLALTSLPHRSAVANPDTAYLSVSGIRQASGRQLLSLVDVTLAYVRLGSPLLRWIRRNQPLKVLY